MIEEPDEEGEPAQSLIPTAGRANPQDDRESMAGSPDGTLDDTRRYRRVALIAMGGQAEIFSAYDSRMGRDVVLKIPHAHASRHFEREVSIITQLEHPNIVPVYDRGVFEGRRYFAMKFVRGGSLRPAILNEPVADLLRKLLRICDAIGYAHARGFVHRDLKPDNIMLGPFGETYVLDWGLGKRLLSAEEPECQPGTAASQTSLLFTREGTARGTPQYMPPEQARGEIGRVDEASDVYALGAILFEILARRPPFHECANGQEILAALRRNSRPSPPGALATDPVVDPELRAIALKAMNPSREERYRGVAQMKEDLLAWQSSLPVSAARPRLDRRASKWIRRHPRTALLLLFALWLTVVGILTAQLVWAILG